MILYNALQPNAGCIDKTKLVPAVIKAFFRALNVIVIKRKALSTTRKSQATATS
jgi:hypothetical protein